MRHPRPIYPVIGPFRIKSVEPIRMTTPEERAQEISEVATIEASVWRQVHFMHQQILRFLVAAMLLSVAPAATAEQLAAEYEITWNGIAVGAFETELVTALDRYKFTYEARTTGLLGWLFPFTSRGWSEGELGDKQTRPERFQVQSRWSDGGSNYGVSFSPDGRAIRVEVEADELADRDPVPTGLQVGPDPLALALEAFARVGPGTALSGGSFDGKRALRFEVACADDLVVPDQAGDGAAQAPIPGLGGKPAAIIACQIDGRLLAGASRRWRSRDPHETDREPVMVWLSRAGLPDSFWPVRVETETRFGGVTARLVTLEPPMANDETTRR
jgi:hypothetical protein